MREIDKRWRGKKKQKRGAGQERRKDSNRGEEKAQTKR